MPFCIGIIIPWSSRRWMDFHTVKREVPVNLARVDWDGLHLRDLAPRKDRRVRARSRSRGLICLQDDDRSHLLRGKGDKVFICALLWQRARV